jgi:hypothetical protein
MPTYVQHQVFNQLHDVFNAEAIWQAPGLALFSRKPTLRDLLERNPREHKGRAATRCFSHITLTLPQDEVDDDYHLTRGAKARELAQTLRELHQKDFGDLLCGEEIRYQVLGDDALSPGQIGIKFGHAVYLPAPEDTLQYQITSSTDSVVWKPVCPIFSRQRLALISGDAKLASFQAPGWPFAADAAILLINDGPGSALQVQVRPKEAFDCRLDAQKGYYVITAKGNHGANAARPARLLLKLTRLGAARASAAASGAQQLGSARSQGARSAQPPSMSAQITAPAPMPTPAASIPALQGIWKNRPNANADGATRHDSDQTALPVARRASAPRSPEQDNDLTYAPLAQQRFQVRLVALALPRLASYRQTGVEALEIGFTRTLGVANTQVRDALAISFEVNAADDIFACTAAGRQQITVPASFAPVDAQEIRLLACPAELAERYRAILCLPHPLSMALASGGRYGFGRGMPTLAALRLLDSPHFLVRAADADIASADRIGLSRHAFSFAATPDGFAITREATTQALYHLDQNLQFVAKIEADQAAAAYALPSGHHLVAGHYVLRFDA